MGTKGLFRKCFLTLVSALFALSFLMPTLLTISNSFMTQSEINANYGAVFSAAAAIPPASKPSWPFMMNISKKHPRLQKSGVKCFLRNGLENW